MEDLHAAEVSLDALQYVFRRLGPTPTLILGSYRSTEVDKRHPLNRLLDGFRGDRRFAAIPLAPLTPAEHRAFVETLVGGSGLTDGLAERLFEGTEGNPFFTKELVRSLLGSGAIPPTRRASGASRAKRRSPPTRCRPPSSRRSRRASSACPRSCASCSRRPR